MTIPNMLAEPPVVIQTGHTCWAAAFESWADANASLVGTTNTTSSQRMIDLFGAPDGGLTLPSGRATPDGIMLMAGLGMMHLVPLRPRRITIEVLGRALNHGYLYVIYFRVRRPAHAIVVYGVEAGNIYAMDPMPGQGLVTLAPNFFLTLEASQLLLGFSLMVDLRRGLDMALAPLLSAGS
jgi:hypothetical protein